jgi:hypothetical protein
MASVTVPTTSTSSVFTSSVRPVWRAGLGAGVVAGVATTAFAAVAQAVDVPIEVSGQAIPVIGFGQMTLLFSLVGLGLAAVFARRSSRPRHTFLTTTLALTALSFVPDVTADATTATKLTLMATHVIAAAIVIPALARRLAD